MEIELNHRRTRFVQEYLISMNATQAAKMAGYAPESAAVTGARILADPAVQQVISQETEARLERLSISADWILSRLKAEALDRSENSSHGARVAALSVLTKCLNMIKPDSTPPESRVTFVINGVSNFERPAIEHQPD